MGRKIGRYNVIGEIGKGGMGVVYKALDPDIDRLVALKTLPRHLAEDDVKYEEYHRRLKREAQAAGRLSHPGIVTVHDVGEYEGGAFIAMEFIDGFNLSSVIRSGPLPPKQVVEIVRQAGVALDYAHERGVIHRDIKPANLILQENGRIKITDFGVARIDFSTLTATGSRIGSPSYMSPEQVRGERVTGKSDIFSLGVVAYQLLTGRKPFIAENVNAVSHKILSEEPTPASELRPSLPPEVDEVLEKAMSKSAEERYASGEAFAVDLAAFFETPSPGRTGLADDEETPIEPFSPTDTLFQHISHDIRSGRGGGSGSYLQTALWIAAPLVLAALLFWIFKG